MPAPLPATLTALLWLATGVVSMFTILGFFSQVDWRIELFSHFRIQYALVLGGCAIIFLFLGHIPGFMTSLGFMGINLAHLLPIYHRRSHKVCSDPIYRLLFANILGTNTRYEQIQKALEKTNADIIILIEVRPNHLPSINASLGAYPYQFMQPDEDNFGLAIFSRLPLESVEAMTLNSTCTPMLLARLELTGHNLTLLGVHSWPPKNKEQAATRNHQLALTASFAASRSGEVLLLGDLNTTSWSHHFRQVLRTGMLLDSRQGIGLQPSWPANNPLFRIPIDHALHTPGICIHARKLGPSTGSDHLPLILDFSFSE